MRTTRAVVASAALLTVLVSVAALVIREGDSPAPQSSEPRHPAQEARTRATPKPRPNPPSRVQPASGSHRPKGSVLVYFSPRNADCYEPSELAPVPRPAPSPAVLRTALMELFEGPTRSERRRGLFSIFGAHSVGFLRQVTIADGTATVDVGDMSEIRQVSTSCAGSHFIGSLTQTVFQFDSIRMVRYLSQGSCRWFWRALESACSDASPITRTEWER